MVNLLIFHLHDMGRYCSPYGHALHTPNIERIAKDGTVFRQAHCQAPTCSPSRAALLTGETSHQSGLYGLAHRGRFRLKDQTKHLGYLLGQNGYETARSGVQHEYNEDAGPIPYQKELTEHLSDPKSRDRNAADAAVEYLGQPKDKPFFLWVGMFLPHRPFINADEHDYPVDFVRTPDHLHDTPEVRAEMRDYAASVSFADECIGRVLDAVESNKLAEDTIIVLTTDHGIDFPKMKCTLSDAGTGVALLAKIPGNKNQPAQSDALVSHLDVFPTVCDLLGLDPPEWLQGKSMTPILDSETDELNDYVFAEINYHAAYDPCRSVRDGRYKLIRIFDDTRTVMPNIGNGVTKQFLMEHGLERDKLRDAVQLYDLHWDPTESNNLYGKPEYAEAQQRLEVELDRWMQETEDPLLHGPMPLPEGALLNRLSDLHPETPADQWIDHSGE